MQSGPKRAGVTRQVARAPSGVKTEESEAGDAVLVSAPLAPAVYLSLARCTDTGPGLQASRAVLTPARCYAGLASRGRGAAWAGVRAHNINYS